MKYFISILIILCLYNTTWAITPKTNSKELKMVEACAVKRVLSYYDKDWKVTQTDTTVTIYWFKYDLNNSLIAMARQKFGRFLNSDTNDILYRTDKDAGLWDGVKYKKCGDDNGSFHFIYETTLGDSIATAIDTDVYIDVDDDGYFKKFRKKSHSMDYDKHSVVETNAISNSILIDDGVLVNPSDKRHKIYFSPSDEFKNDTNINFDIFLNYDFNMLKYGFDYLCSEWGGRRGNHIPYKIEGDYVDGNFRSYESKIKIYRTEEGDISDIIYLKTASLGLNNGNIAEDIKINLIYVE